MSFRDILRVFHLFLRIVLEDSMAFQEIQEGSHRIGKYSLNIPQDSMRFCLVPLPSIMFVRLFPRVMWPWGIPCCFNHYAIRLKQLLSHDLRIRLFLCVTVLIIDFCIGKVYGRLIVVHYQPGIICRLCKPWIPSSSTQSNLSRCDVLRPRLIWLGSRTSPSLFVIATRVLSNFSK